MSIPMGSLVKLNWAKWDDHAVGIVLRETTPDYTTSLPRVEVRWLNDNRICDMIVKYLSVVSDGTNDN